MTGPDTRGRFEALASRLAPPALAIVDARVLRLHRQLGRTLHARGVTVLPLRAGESAKSLEVLGRLTRAALPLPRRATVLAIGGGTVGDVATVFAHTFKRGVGRFIQVPTTLLAAVDSSLGGKGAVNVAGAKNVLGVFHEADECWLCPELFTTLSEAQRREGRLEAWKMVVTLDARTFRSWRAQPPDDEELIRVARALKRSVVTRDPQETKGLRVVLNFGHTYGHVIESLSRYRVRHGDAVGLGMLYALDEGVRRGVTPRSVAQEVERALPLPPRARAALQRWTAKKHAARTRQLLLADKKGAWVLLERPGKWRLVK